MKYLLLISSIFLLTGCASDAVNAEPTSTVTVIKTIPADLEPAPTVTLPAETITAVQVAEPVPTVPQVCLDAIQGAQKAQNNFATFIDIVYDHLEADAWGFEAAMYSDMETVGSYIEEQDVFNDRLAALLPELDSDWLEAAVACQNQA